MSMLESIILGLVQGLSEFLPISSSGHLAALQHFFGISSDNVLTFTVMLHFGTLIAIFAAYWRDIADLIVELFATLKDIFTGKGVQVNKNETRKLGVMIIISTIPTAVIGLLFDNYFNALYSSMLFIGAALLVTGTCLWIAERKGGGKKGVKEMTWKNALFIGFCQAVAICPGISRSGATMVGGLASKFNRAHAVRYAFLISIPSVLGAFLLELPDAVHAASSEEGVGVGVMAAGIIVAAISGYAAIKVMIKAVTQEKLFYFSIYTWIVGLFLIGYSVVTMF